MKWLSDSSSYHQLRRKVCLRSNLSRELGRKRNLKGACLKGRVQSRLVNAALNASARNHSTLSGLGMTQGARAFWTVGLPLFVLTVSGFYGLSHLVQGKFDVQVGSSQRIASALLFQA